MRGYRRVVEQPGAEGCVAVGLVVMMRDGLDRVVGIEASPKHIRHSLHRRLARIKMHGRIQCLKNGGLYIDTECLRNRAAKRPELKHVVAIRQLALVLRGQELLADLILVRVEIGLVADLEGIDAVKAKGLDAGGGPADGVVERVNAEGDLEDVLGRGEVKEQRPEGRADSCVADVLVVVFGGDGEGGFGLRGDEAGEVAMAGQFRGVRAESSVAER